MLKSGLPRNELFFTSKVPPKDINYQAAKACVDESLKKTGLDYIDLYLLHSPSGDEEARTGAWKALVEAVEAGKVKSIGVSNYGVHHLEELEKWQQVRDSIVRPSNLPGNSADEDLSRSNPKARAASSASTKSSCTPGFHAPTS
jgi:diketogulonate reductase-like aldo/keto reductase